MYKHVLNTEILAKRHLPENKHVYQAELHCEAAWAQMGLVKAVLDFIEGENILCFIKGALGMALLCYFQRTISRVH